MAGVDVIDNVDHVLGHDIAVIIDVVIRRAQRRVVGNFAGALRINAIDDRHYVLSDDEMVVINIAAIAGIVPDIFFDNGDVEKLRLTGIDAALGRAAVILRLNRDMYRPVRVGRGLKVQCSGSVGFNEHAWQFGKQLSIIRRHVSPC